ncbi:MAG: hypothetical protein CUN55_20025 [Phototrophicales bacterium]|nr:MAG: hypothetical protein CUN55_20025 [Phototrophicales bacterium]
MDVGLSLINQQRFEDARLLYEEAFRLGENIHHEVIMGEAEAGLAKIEQIEGNHLRANELISNTEHRFEVSGVSRLPRAEQFCFII